MKLIDGDIWKIPALAKVIPTNGVLDSQGCAVMGAGVAKQAANRVPVLPGLLGHRIQKYGNRLFAFRLRNDEVTELECQYLITLPTKNDWRDLADEKLLAHGVEQLEELSQMMNFSNVLLPEIGMGLGGLPKTIVYPILELYLDDKYTVVRYATEKGM